MNNALKTLRPINFLQIFLCFCITWSLFYVLFVIFFGDGIILGKALIYNLLVPSLMFFLIGIIINYNAQESTIIPFRYVLIAITVLFILDQGIKVVVVRHQETVISIIDNWLLFKVYFNTGHFVNSIGIYIPTWFYVFIPVLPILVFRAAVFYKKNRYILTISTMLTYAGMLCFYTDKIVYGGSYDYLYLKQFAIVDLKDIYLTIAVFVYFQSFIYNQQLSALKKELCTDPLGLQYAHYEYHHIKQWLSRKK